MTEFRTGVIQPIECFKEGWELIKDQYWMMFGITLVGALIGGISMYILLGAMMCGIYLVYLHKIDGKPVSFDTLWLGFQKWLPGLILTILIFVPLIAVYVIIYIPFIIAAVMGPKLSSGELMTMLVSFALVDLVLIVLMTCFHTLLIFSFPLIADRDLGVWDSIKVSAKAVWQNLGGVAAMIGILFVATFVGTLVTCGVGVYFLMPIMFAGYTVAYRKIFPAANPGGFNQPPPPNAFQGAGNYN